MRFSTATLITVLACATLPAAAAASDLEVRQSKHSVQVTLDRLTATLKERGITPIARVDHAAAAKGANLELKPTQVLIFGNPKLGTPLMQENRHVAIELPMRVLAWEDEKGLIWVAYTKPDILKTRYGLVKQDQGLKAMSDALAGLVKSAAE